MFQLKNAQDLKLNIDKSKAKFIGILKNNDYFSHDFSWLKDKDHIESLRIVYVDTEEDNYKYNFQSRLVKLRNTLQIWKQRDLSLKGKITVVNNLALAPVIYVSCVISTPTRVITELHK